MPRYFFKSTYTYLLLYCLYSCGGASDDSPCPAALAGGDLTKPWEKSCHSCFEDSIPVNSQTRTKLWEILSKVQSSDEDLDNQLLDAEVLTWTLSGQKHVSVLPVGTKVIGSLRAAQQQLQNDGTLHFVRPEPRNVRGDLPLLVWRGQWPSAQLITHIFHILVEDVLRIRVDSSSGSMLSMHGVRSLAGCSPTFYIPSLCNLESPSAHVMLESWATINRALSAPGTDQKIHPIPMGLLGYQGVEGTFLRSNVAEAAAAEKLQLDFYGSYKASSFPDLYMQFDNIASLFSVINQSEATTCTEISKQDTKVGSYGNFTSDSEGLLHYDGHIQPNCGAQGEGRVWYAPACRSNPDRCIPWVTVAAYKIHMAMQHAYFFQLPLAIVDLSPSAWRDAVTKLRVLTYWWQPDPSFNKMTNILMPTYNQQEQETGLYRTGFATAGLSKYAWRHLMDLDLGVYNFLLLFNFNADEMESMMSHLSEVLESEQLASESRETNLDTNRPQLWAASSQTYYAAACAWVRNNSDKWVSWVPKACPRGMEMTAASGCSKCTPGRYGNGYTCEECPSGKFSSTHGSDVCQGCAPDSTSQQGSSTCYSTADVSITFEVLLSVGGCLLVLTVLLVACCLIRRVTAVSRDQPDLISTQSGQWTQTWVGPHVHMRLKLCKARTSMRNIVGTRSSEGSGRNSTGSWTSEGSWGFVSKMTASKSERDERGICCKRFRTPNWIVNATPFAITITEPNHSSGNAIVSLPSEGFCKANRLSISGSLTFRINTCETLLGEDSWIPTVYKEITITKSDWLRIRPGREKFETENQAKFGQGFSARSLKDLMGSDSAKNLLGERHQGKGTHTVRRDLSDNNDGQIKLVFKHPSKKRFCFGFAESRMLLIMWSPPHTLRGVPLRELQLFFDRVMKDTQVWHRQIPGETTTTIAKPRERNMYDANEYIIKKEAASYDASYAEIATDFGPPTVFVSHVWGETAEITSISLNKLKDGKKELEAIADKRRSRSKFGRQVSPSLFAGAQDGTSSAFTTGCRRTSETLATQKSFSERNALEMRLWFCAVCNNQARIDDELGDDIMHSSFAQVLREPDVDTVVLISPLRALERKWCTFEFTMAVTSGKMVMMATRDGIIEAGQVAPRFLKKMSDKLVEFDCSKATCNNSKDAEMIDKAVETLGGYAVIDGHLRNIFGNAIKEAQYWADEAFGTLTTLTNEDIAAEQEDMMGAQTSEVALKDIAEEQEDNVVAQTSEVTLKDIQLDVDTKDFLSNPRSGTLLSL